MGVVVVGGWASDASSHQSDVTLAATVSLDLGWAQVWQKTGEHRA